MPPNTPTAPANVDFGALINQQAPVQASATPDQQEQIKTGWLQHLNRPEVKAGLLQFAASILQPVGPGQSQLGAIGQAAGAAGQAIARSTEQQTSEAQRQTENAQRERQVKVQERQATTAERQAGVQERQVGVQEEGLDIRRTANEIAREQLQVDRDRIAADTQNSRETIASLERRLTQQLASTERLSNARQDQALLQASITAAAAGVDPLLFDTTTPEGRAAYDQALSTATQRGINNYMLLRQLRPYDQAPELYTPSTIKQALTRNPIVGEANLRAMGVPEDMINANRPTPEEIAAFQQQAGTAPTAPQATPGGVTQVPTPAQQAAAAPRTVRGGRTFSGAEPTTPAPQANTIEGAGAIIRSSLPDSAERQDAENALQGLLPAAIHALPQDQFKTLYDNNATRRVLEQVYGAEMVNQRYVNSLTGPAAR